MIFKYSVFFLLIFRINCSEKKYMGESFPVKYLQAEDVFPDSSDVEYYLEGLNRMLGKVDINANETCINRALGTFFLRAILKRTIKENKNKLTEKQQKLMKTVLLKAENIMSHYLYFAVRNTTWEDEIKRVSELFKDEDLQIDGISDYNRNRLQKWILSDVKFNDFAKDMDEIKLPKNKYLKHLEISTSSEEYIINIGDSDYCLAEVIYNPKPVGEDTKTLRPCVANQFCSDILYYRGPSLAYTLSHRMLNIMFPRHLRRCYMRSPEEDDELVDNLCSSMYREAVYIARRGYFNRDMWIEHVALCAFYGYEEFHRRHWFRKIMSWIDDEGCLSENFNYDVNRTAYRLSRVDDPDEKKKIRQKLKDLRVNPCHWHQMAVSLVALGHAVRHAVHFSQIRNEVVKDEL